jgi:voltage-gated potassium channel
MAKDGGHPGKSLRRRLAEALDPDLRHEPGLSPANGVFALLILASTVMVILETEEPIFLANRAFFWWGERIVGAIFIAEYLVRAWCAQENPQFGRGWRGVFRYVFSIGSLVDLLAIVPSLFLLNGQATLSLRIFRILRMARVARLGRLSNAWEHMIKAIAARREELFLAFAAGLILMLLSSSLLYMVEGPVQPMQFGSIPRAMWWSVITLTTIGYGDAVPVTVFGRILAAFTALAGIGLIAMPTGIIAAALSDSVQLRRIAEEQFERDEREKAQREAEEREAEERRQLEEREAELRRIEERKSGDETDPVT